VRTGPVKLFDRPRGSESHREVVAKRPPDPAVRLTRPQRLVRWIAALPSAAVAGALVYALPRLLLKVGLLPLVTPRPTSAFAYYIGLATCALAGGMFVFMAHRIAPKWRLSVAVALNVVALGFAIVTFSQFAFGAGTPAAALGAIWLFLGSFVGTVPLIDLDSHPGADDQLAAATEMRIR
jgi:hypothetical protein